MLSWACILCGYELHAQAVSLVQAQRTRPSMASDAQSLCHPRVGVHAAADAGQQGFGLLSAVFEAIPHARLARALETQGCHGGVGWPGLLRASAEPPYAGAGSHTSARRHATRYPRGVADTTRCRTVHSGGSGVLCVRETGGNGGYERRSRAAASVLWGVGSGEWDDSAKTNHSPLPTIPPRRVGRGRIDCSEG